MKRKTTQYTLLVWALVALHLLLGLGAVVSGLLLIVAPDGHLMQMPLTTIKNTPFSTFVVPGLLLFTFIGLYPLIVAYCLFAQPGWGWPNIINPFKAMHWSWTASLSAGVILIIWSCVQMLLLATVAALQILYLVWGGLILVLTLIPAVRRSYSSHSAEETRPYPKANS